MADSRKEPERGIYAHLCRFTVENTSDPDVAMLVRNSSLKRHKCRAPIVFLNQPRVGPTSCSLNLETRAVLLHNWDVPYGEL
jgi:hypothetical protein